MQIREDNGYEFAITYYPYFERSRQIKFSELEFGSEMGKSSVKIFSKMVDELNLEEKTEYQKSGGYIETQHKTVMEADTLREHIESLIQK